jgi:hypothetical protein
MSLQNEFRLRVENFVPVRSHQSAAMNEHLSFMLDQFDSEFGKLSIYGSPRHLQERIEFARFVSGLLAQNHINIPGEITRLKTETERTMSGIGTIHIESFWELNR